VRGEIIGINSAIFTKTGGWQGISFAVPSNTAKRVFENILKRGRNVRGWLGGVSYQSLTPRLARGLGVPDLKGALITQTASGSTAERAGLRAGDVIRKLNGKEVEDSRSFLGMISAIEPGSAAEIEVLREGQIGTAKITVEEMPRQISQPR
jgi:S1-C subfamily serine protease